MDGSINFSGTLAGSIADDGGGKIQDIQTNASGDYETVVDEQGIAKIDLSNYTTGEQLESAVDNINSVLVTKQNIINYSTTEQLTGRTLHGKPTYIKIFELSNMQPNTEQEIAENIDDIILHDICVITSNSKYYPSTISMYNYQGGGTLYATVSLYTDTHKLALANQSRTNIIGCRAIIEYTKKEV